MDHESSSSDQGEKFREGKGAVLLSLERRPKGYESECPRGRPRSSGWGAKGSTGGLEGSACLLAGGGKLSKEKLKSRKGRRCSKKNDHDDKVTCL